MLHTISRPTESQLHRYGVQRRTVLNKWSWWSASEDEDENEDGEDDDEDDDGDGDEDEDADEDEDEDADEDEEEDDEDNGSPRMWPVQCGCTPHTPQTSNPKLA